MCFRACYSLLFANTDETIFLRKKLSFAKHDENVCLHTIRHQQQFLRKLKISLKWVTHYLQTTIKPGRNESFTKKFCKFAKHDKNHATHYSWVWLLQFTWKIPLSLSWRRLVWWNKTNHVSQKTVLQNATNHLLHTIRGMYQFCCFLHILLWFANSV